jgi:hypothetical protein
LSNNQIILLVVDAGAVFVDVDEKSVREVDLVGHSESTVQGSASLAHLAKSFALQERNLSVTWDPQADPFKERDSAIAHVRKQNIKKWKAKAAK